MIYETSLSNLFSVTYQGSVYNQQEDINDLSNFYYHLFNIIYQVLIYNLICSLIRIFRQMTDFSMIVISEKRARVETNEVISTSKNTSYTPSIVSRHFITECELYFLNFYHQLQNVMFKIFFFSQLFITSDQKKICRKMLAKSCVDLGSDIHL